MAQVRDVLGHVTVETAKGPRICHRNRRKHAIGKGELCLVIANDNGGSKNYCAVCAKEILRKARDNLSMLATGLGMQDE